LLRTPVLLITYKRMDTTVQVMESIRAVRPARLYISSNAPDPRKPEDGQKVSEVRNVLEKMIDWPCTVEKLYRVEHLSARDSIWSAIRWFFSKEEEGIVLEDDILPEQSFYFYCQEMLERFRDNEKVQFINGCNFGYHNLRSASYGFTKYMNMWGWAGWRRSVQDVDITMESWSSLPDKKTFLEGVFSDQPAKTRQLAIEHFGQVFNDTYSGKINTWDYQAILSVWQSDSLCIFPARNQTRNLGFNNDGTHTNFESYFLSDMKSFPLDFPLIHGQKMETDGDYEKFVLERWANLKIKNRFYYSIVYRIFKFKKRLKKYKR